MGKPVRHGTKWRIRWFDEKDHRKSEVHDDFRVAQRKLREHELAVDEIVRGLRDPPPVDHTFSELCDYWIENRVPLKRSGDDDLSILRVHLRPAFGRMKLHEMGIEQFDLYKVERAALAKQTVRNHLTLLVTMLNLAVELGWLRHRPRIKKPQVDSQDYRWLRTDDEVARFLRAARGEGELVYAFYAAAVYTGMRAGELAGLRWDHVSFERRQIAVQRSYDGVTKSGKVRHVPILDPLLPLLREWRLRQPCKIVFPNERDGMFDDSATIFQETLHRVLDRAGFPKEEIPRRRPTGKKKPASGISYRWYITFHGLRHTFASHWVMKGGDLFKLQKILGHSTIRMTERYAHLQPTAYREDYGRLGTSAPGAGGELVELALHAK